MSNLDAVADALKDYCWHNQGKFLAGRHCNLQYQIRWQEGGYELYVWRPDKTIPSAIEVEPLRTALGVPDYVRMTPVKRPKGTFGAILWGSQNYEIEKIAVTHQYAPADERISVSDTANAYPFQRGHHNDASKTHGIQLELPIKRMTYRNGQ